MAQTGFFKAILVFFNKNKLTSDGFFFLSHNYAATKLKIRVAPWKEGEVVAL